MTDFLAEKIYLVLGIGTDVGKTFFVERIISLLRKQNVAVNVIKPISSGFDDGDKKSDSARILSALNLEVSLKNIKSISPWRFKEAVSPHFAAKNQNQEINFDELEKFCFDQIATAKKTGEFLFIEAAGGVMTPVNFEKTFLDLAIALQIPVLLVANNYLGAISHSLTALQVLRDSGVKVEKLILNEFGDYGVSIRQTIEKLGNIEILDLSQLNCHPERERRIS